jgi:solute carrier family 30 (zinc transporter), member 2
MGDMLMSVGVCIAGTVIYFFPEWHILDPICTILFSIIVFFTVIPIIKQCIGVLMEGAPSEIDVAKLMDDMKTSSNVKEMHDFHLWQISVGKYALTCHIDSNTPLETLKIVTKVCQEKYNIDHLTIQMEDSENEKTKFNCHQETHSKMCL